MQTTDDNSTTTEKLGPGLCGFVGQNLSSKARPVAASTYSASDAHHTTSPSTEGTSNYGVTKNTKKLRILNRAIEFLTLICIHRTSQHQSLNHVHARHVHLAWSKDLPLSWTDLTPFPPQANVQLWTI